MKKQIIIYLFLVSTLLVNACSGAPATPAINAVDVQNTAVAVAFTIVAETQAAIPTNTLPPTLTNTPIPTETPIPTATLLVTETATAVILPTTASGADPCDKALTYSPSGTPTKIKLENKTGAPITASIYMNLTPFGECGYRGYNIPAGGAVNITDFVYACYNVSVFVNDPNKPTKSFGYGCINNPDQWTFVITREQVVLKGR
jgi:hypothetical protein